MNRLITAPSKSKPVVRAARQGSLRQPNHKLQSAEVDALVADYLAGMSLRKLGEKHSLHRQTAKAHLERRGLTVRAERPAFVASDVPVLVALYESGSTLQEIGQRYDVAPNTVKVWLVRAGVVLRPRRHHRVATNPGSLSPY